MNFCSNCGSKNMGNNFCTNCGNKLGVVNVNKNSSSNGLKTASIVLGIIGIVGSLTFVSTFIGMVVSIVGLILGIVATKKGKNVAGIVLNSVGMVLSIGILLLMGMFIRWVVDITNGHDDAYEIVVPSIDYYY